MTTRAAASRLLSDYGVLVVLLILCAVFSYATWAEQHPTGAAGAESLSKIIAGSFGKGTRILVVARSGEEDVIFAQVLTKSLTEAGLDVMQTVKGDPRDARQAFEAIAREGGKIDAIATIHSVANWTIFDDFSTKFPSLAGAKVFTPPSYWWPNFLKTTNLLNVANQIAVIAILAIGMTMVVITGGIDLSVGSLIALSAVVATLLIRDLFGAEKATAASMVLCSSLGVAMCALVGTFSGVMVAIFLIPPFIATLAMMLVGSGLAYLLSAGQSVYKIPDSFVWLGRGTDVAGIPNAVVLMVILYAAAHGIMTRTTLGRYIHAVGGNMEAARLSGVRVKRIVILVYAICGGLAGLGGIVTASQLKSGSPTYGLMYELYVIAAVVVGGTSLSGGEGKIMGTLIGAFLIAVIQNGMNLVGMESYTQKVILGLVILAAVLLDMLKKRWKWLQQTAY